MKQFFAAAVCSAVIAAKPSSYPLSATVDGLKTTLYVQPTDWSSADVEESTVQYNYGNRMYLSTVDSVDTDKYFKPNMLGGTMEYDVDLSQVGCGCDSAIYGVLMPAVDNETDVQKYCDANKVGGHWCPEFDVMEANKYAFRVTGHKCDAPDASGVYSNCDRSGSCT